MKGIELAIKKAIKGGYKTPKSKFIGKDKIDYQKIYNKLKSYE